MLMRRDTQVIRKFRGQFALVYWDGEKRSLSLVRDHLGQRSLFVRTENDYIYFCSELDPLLSAPAAENILNEEGVFWYLAFGMPPPGQTLVKNIKRVPAAHLIRWEFHSSLMLQRYWSPLQADSPIDVTNEFIEKARSTLELSTYRRLTSSQKQGLFLSGGVDSTFLAVTAKMMGVSLNSFTSEFDEAYGINETDYAAVVSKWLDVPHYVVPVTVERSLEQMNEAVLSAAEPCSAWAVLTHFQILSAAQQLGIKSMLSGLGADEILGGYDHFRGYYSRYIRYKLNRWLPQGTHPFEALLMTESQAERRILYPGVARFFDDKSLRIGLKEPYAKWQYAGHLREFYRECMNLKPEVGVMEMMVAHECQHRIPDLLFACFEPLSRRMGIDMKYPFLDPDFIELVAGLSVTGRYRTPAGQFSLKLKKLMPRFKYAMMKIAEDRVPKDICERPRKSYTLPFGQWLFHPGFSSYVFSRINNSRFWEQNIVNKQYVDHIIRNIVPGPNPYAFQAWVLFTLIEWYERFIERRK
jgi:asparagine synthase (glutamine-hydrolysing)